MTVRAAILCAILCAGCDGASTVADGGTDIDDGAAVEDMASSADFASAPDLANAPSCTLCASYATPANVGSLPMGLNEASGIVASRAHPGIFYSHNDSGDSARIFAFDEKGALLAHLTLMGATHEDYEDIAIGPCPQGTCIYVGDIGDNSHNRFTKTVYRFPEPALTLGMAAVTMPITGVEALNFGYPGLFNNPNAETLLVHPTSGDVYVVTKEDKGVPSKVYKFPQPLTPTASATLTLLTTMSFPSGNDPDVSGGDIHPCGDAVIFRVSYAHVFVLTRPQGQPFDSIFSQSPVDAPMPAMDGNAEAISWSADGRGYYTTTEGPSAPIHFVACTH